MKLDPDIHIVMHSVLFLKLGVTPVAMEYAARLQRVASWGHMCQPKVGRNGLGGYSWFVCCGSCSDGGP